MVTLAPHAVPAKDSHVPTSSVYLTAAWAGAAAGAATGLVCGAFAARYLRRSASGLLTSYGEAMRRALPRHVILVRHGESQANADHTLLREKADNLIELTALGSRQASAAGARILNVVGGAAKVHIYVSPFQRTLQTARQLEVSYPAS